MKEKILLERIVKKASFLALFMFLISTMGFANGPKVLKVKGFYLGMSGQEACNEICKNAGVSQCKMETNPLFVFGSVSLPDDSGKGFIRVTLDNNTKKAVKIEISITYFGADRSIIKEFAEKFIEKYGIPGMTLIRDDEYDQMGYYYKSPNGYEVTIIGDYIPNLIIREITPVTNLDFS